LAVMGDPGKPACPDIDRTTCSAHGAAHALTQRQHWHISHTSGGEPAQVDASPMAAGQEAIDNPLRVKVGNARGSRHGAMVALRGGCSRSKPCRLRLNGMQTEAAPTAGCASLRSRAETRSCATQLRSDRSGSALPRVLAADKTAARSHIIAGSVSFWRSHMASTATGVGPPRSGIITSPKRFTNSTANVRGTLAIMSQRTRISGRHQKCGTFTAMRASFPKRCGASSAATSMCTRRKTPRSGRNPSIRPASLPTKLTAT
jgi:hypothetical protein